MSVFGPRELLPPHPGLCVICQEVLELEVFRPPKCTHMLHMQCAQEYVRSRFVQNATLKCPLCPELYDASEFEVPEDIETLREEERERQDMEQRERTRQILERERMRMMETRANARRPRESEEARLLREPRTSERTAVWYAFARYMIDTPRSELWIKMSTTRLKWTPGAVVRVARPWNKFYAWSKITAADVFWLIHDYTKQPHSFDEVSVILKRDGETWRLSAHHTKAVWDDERRKTTRVPDTGFYNMSSQSELEIYEQFFSLLERAAAMMEPKLCKVAVSVGENISPPGDLLALRFKANENAILALRSTLRPLFMTFNPNARPL